MLAEPRDVQRLVVPLDGTLFALRALVPARLLADVLGVPIELVTVRYGERRADVEQELRASARSEGLEHVGITIVDDEPVSASEAIAELVKPDSLVCMTTHARRGIALAALGSVARDLVRRVHAPIVLVGPCVDVERLEPVREVVACVDGSGASGRIVSEVAALARRSDAAMRVLEIAHPDPDVRRAQTIDGRLLDTHELARVASGTGVPTSCRIVESADAAAAIVEQASGPGTIVAMVSHARRGLERVVLGSTTNEVVRHARVPVVVFRPAALGG